MLSIHIETGNIFYDNCNTGESVYVFFCSDSKTIQTKTIQATLIYTDSFSNYIKYFLDDIDAETVDKHFCQQKC